MLVEVSLFRKSLDVFQNFLASRVLVNEVFVFIVAEAWEFVQLTWHLESRICGVAAPNTTNVSLRFEERAFDL